MRFLPKRDPEVDQDGKPTPRPTGYLIRGHPEHLEPLESCTLSTSILIDDTQLIPLLLRSTLRPNRFPRRSSRQPHLRRMSALIIYDTNTLITSCTYKTIFVIA
jgi:hypothetical protein